MQISGHTAALCTPFNTFSEGQSGGLPYLLVNLKCVKASLWCHIGYSAI